MMRPVLVVTLLLALGPLAACGKRGPLSLPDAPAPSYNEKQSHGSF